MSWLCNGLAGMLEWIILTRSQMCGTEPETIYKDMTHRTGLHLVMHAIVYVRHNPLFALVQLIQNISSI